MRVVHTCGKTNLLAIPDVLGNMFEIFIRYWLNICKIWSNHDQILIRYTFGYMWGMIYNFEMCGMPEISMRFAWDMLRYPKHMPKIYIWYAWEMREMYLRYAWKKPQICLEYIWDMPKICLRYSSCVPVIFQIYAWDMSEICVRYAWVMPEICLRYAWYMP